LTRVAEIEAALEAGQIIILDKNMPICQLILEEVRETPSKGYIGRFSEQRGFTEGD